MTALRVSRSCPGDKCVWLMVGLFVHTYSRTKHKATCSKDTILIDIFAAAKQRWWRAT